MVSATTTDYVARNIMHIRVFLFAAVVSFWFGCNCGGMGSPCDGVRCATGLACDEKTGRCAVTGSGGGSGGGFGGGAGGGGGVASDGGSDAGAMGTCNPACGANAPLCDPATNSCKICTDTLGCSGATPVCLTIANGGFGRCMACTVEKGCVAPRQYCDPTVQPAGACVECRTSNDCSNGLVCDLDGTCVVNDGGFGGGGGSGGGGGGIVEFDDAGLTAHCLPFDGGAQACTTECQRGFVCVGGQCVLRGSAGPVQVTLRFPQDEDLDLHVVEPLGDGGSCEIWYGAPNIDASIPIPIPIPIPNRNCGAQGWLDLDSNPACRIDSVRIENVIYPASAPAPKGHYTVRVDYFQNCSAVGTVPYEVEVRANGQRRYYCGSFQHTQSDQGSAGSGVTVTTFDIR